MLTAFGRAFKTPDLRRKLLFTMAIIVIYRLGVHVPVPGVSYPLVQQCIQGADNTNGLLGLVNLFSGGALLQLSIFALGIMPYITASIIVQLLTVVIPRFEALKKEGQAGQSKMTQYTRYLTIALAVLQSSTLITFAQNPQTLFSNPACTNILSDNSTVTILIMVLTMTAGTGMIMWLGELITDKGVGNGMSLLIFVSIASGFPASLWAIQQRSGWTVSMPWACNGRAVTGPTQAGSTSWFSAASSSGSRPRSSARDSSDAAAGALVNVSASSPRLTVASSSRSSGPMSSGAIQR